jgi:hypothetical protein
VFAPPVGDPWQQPVAQHQYPLGQTPPPPLPQQNAPDGTHVVLSQQSTPDAHEPDPQVVLDPLLPLAVHVV